MSSSILSSRPTPLRKTSHVPGEFEPTNDEGSEAGSMDHLDDEYSQDISLLPGPQDPSSLLQPHDENSGADLPNNTVLEEREMRNKLMDVESSFLPEVSHLANNNGPSTGTDDSYLFGVSNDNLAVRKKPHPINVSGPFRNISAGSSIENEDYRSPRTPPESYKTPAPEQQNFHESEGAEDVTPEIPNTSALEAMSTSPTAARTVSRVQSLATLGGYETAAEDGEYDESPSKKPPPARDEDATPKTGAQSIPMLNASSVADTTFETTRSQPSRRPKYLSSRSSQARLSYDSMASSNTDASDATLGADFALQSGGAVADPKLQRKERVGLSRQTSLGSVLSGFSGTSDDEARPGQIPNASNLSTLHEECPRSNTEGNRTFNDLITPRASANNLVMPTDTVIANNVRDIEVPGTFARQYRQERNKSPSKTLLDATPGPKRGLTLKEHRSTVEKLGKENFDLKMKIHFLDQALQKRSEDGVKEMITENVQLKSDRMRLEKDSHALRKQVRELQRKLEESGNRESSSADPGYATDEERSPTMEEEVFYLRERVETTEVEVEKLRAENLAKETEKRRLAEMIRSLGDTRASSSDVGSREERDMWKDMLEAETIAREQSEDDNKRLRDEMAKLRQDTLGSGRNSRKSRLGVPELSRTGSREAVQAQTAELERLHHEISELQKTISAQASALTSRNKEKERLYQEIEELKLGRMGGRSVAGDSIFDRSASRVRSHSRASNNTRVSRMSDQERDSFEIKINELRDELSQLKLDNQALQGQFDEALTELDAVDQQAQADADQFNEELATLSQERENALRGAEEQDHAFQQLKNEAQEEIDGLGDELDAKIEECERLQEDLSNQSENVKVLQGEMHSAGEGLIRLEEDAQSNLARYQSVKAELDDANRELENMENNLSEAESKIKRLTVQQESSHNEIAFLREEQDGDKIKIGDLESLLKKVHLNLESEREKARELERNLTSERQQREVVASKEKKDVQRVINDLNKESSSAKDELRTVRKTLSSREIELNTSKERYTELEESLRHILGDPNATRSSLVSALTKMQRELDQATVDLDATRRRLDEKETTLTNREQLLETNSLEYRKLVDALEKERQGRRQDKHSFEQSLKSHQQSARALTANSSRITELEQARIGDRKRLAQLEAQFKDQLSERNQVLLTIWKKLSAMCGPDWTHNNSLINGNLPSQEVIGNMLFWPGFSRNLLLAAKQVEGTLLTFKDRIKRVERDLWKEYQALEHTLELRTKKLERVEQAWDQVKLKQVEWEAQMSSPHGSRTPKSSKTPEMSKLKGENRLLKAELQLLQQQHQRSHLRRESKGSMFSNALSNEGTAASGDGTANDRPGLPPRSSSMRRTKVPGLERSHTSNIVEHLANFNNSRESNSMRTNSFSSRNSGLVSHQDRGGERERGLMIPAGPMMVPSNGNFSIPPPREPAPHPPGPLSQASTSDLGSMVSAGTSGPGQEKWIHRLRELERRLKAEREARLQDRTSMRKRLEERDAVNEELRNELGRERVRRSIDSPAAAERERFPPYVDQEPHGQMAELEEGEQEQEERTPVPERRQR